VDTSFGRILVTGSNGLVGMAMKKLATKSCLNRFIFCDSKDCDLTNYEDTLRYVDKIHPDSIIHLAALSGGVQLSMNHPATLLRDNSYMTLNIVEAARIHSVKKIVLTLSSGMYPESSPDPIQETFIHDGAPHISNYGYSFAKRLIEPVIRSYRSEYDMSVIGLVPNGIYGEHGNFSYEEAPMWASLIRRFHENADSERNIVIWGDGTPLREHTYAEDIARAFLWCLDHYDSADILNIGTTEEYSVSEIAYMIADNFNVDKSRIIFDTLKPTGIHRKSTDNSNFVSQSHFVYTPFKDGLAKTINWFKENYPNPNKIRL